MAAFSPAWYDELHRGVRGRRPDLKSVPGHAALARLLAHADLLLTSQRPAALARLGIDRSTMTHEYPNTPG
jgi:alpha-methylacyl-CoA racemase